MLKHDVLDNLFDARWAVAQQIVDISPTNHAERAKIHALLGARDHLSAAINSVIAASFKEIADSAELKAAGAQLADKAKDLGELQGKIADVNTAIAVVGQIVDLVVAIIKLAAA